MSVAIGSDRAREVRFRSWDRLDGLLFERLGMTVRDTHVGRQGYVLVDRVSADGPAHDLGLQKGDLIPAIRPIVGRVPNALRIRDRNTLAQVVSRLDTGVRVDLDVYRDEDRDREFSREEFYQGSLEVR